MVWDESEDASLPALASLFSFGLLASVLRPLALLLKTEERRGLCLHACSAPETTTRVRTPQNLSPVLRVRVRIAPASLQQGWRNHRKKAAPAASALS